MRRKTRGDATRRKRKYRKEVQGEVKQKAMEWMTLTREQLFLCEGEGRREKGEKTESEKSTTLGKKPTKEMRY